MFIQALVIVNVLAPNALTISLSDPVIRDIQVPTLNLSSTEVEYDPIAAVDGIPSIPVNLFADVRVVPKWEAILQSILLYPPETNWDIPEGCGTACYFEMEYNGPALQCRDIIPGEYHLDPDSSYTVSYTIMHSLIMHNTP